MSIAAELGCGFSNVFVTAPSPENLKTLFEFIFKGLESLGYKENMHYEVIQSTNPDFNNSVIRVNVFKTHRQFVQYILPNDYDKLGQADLVVIDEAAAIPLIYVKKLLGPYLVFLSSTINGYEGTGRSLSLKLIQKLREEKKVSLEDGGLKSAAGGRVLKEITLNDPIRYSLNDSIEKWLNELLLLNVYFYLSFDFLINLHLNFRQQQPHLYSKAFLIPTIANYILLTEILCSPTTNQLRNSSLT